MFGLQANLGGQKRFCHHQPNISHEMKEGREGEGGDGEGEDGEVGGRRSLGGRGWEGMGEKKE